MRKILRTIVILLIVALVIIQFIRPAKNTGVEIASNQITAKFTVPDNVNQVLKVSCYDCHSNTTVYPWYWHIQPGAWILSNHFNDGKRHLNFSEFSTYPARRQYHKLEEIAEEVKGGEMPLTSYTLMHRDAKLSPEQKQSLIDWANAARKSMEATYPADSLRKSKN